MSKFKIFAATMMVCVLALGGVFLYNKTENKKKLTKTEIVKKFEAFLQKEQQEGSEVKASVKLMPNEEIEIRIDMLPEEYTGTWKEKKNEIDIAIKHGTDTLINYILNEVIKKLFEEVIPDWKQQKKRINVTFRLVFCHEGKVFYSETYAAADL